MEIELSLTKKAQVLFTVVRYYFNGSFVDYGQYGPVCDSPATAYNFLLKAQKEDPEGDWIIEAVVEEQDCGN